jgi:DNA (cytosine-5)-methyltransferase 1
VSSDQRAIINDHITRAVRADDAEAFSLLRPGGTYEELPARLQRYRSDIFTDKYKRLEWTQPSRTITAHLAKDGYWYIHPDQDRTLSVREAARIQTFPDWYRFSGHPTARYRQIGNAVPPFLAEAVGDALIAALSQSSRRGGVRIHDAETFRSRLISWHGANKRSFPWRDGADPWHVLMAEMCLHRTRASQVVPVYEELVRIAPTPGDMVRKPAAVLLAMRSLGLRWRAENLVEVATVLVSKFGGNVPRSELELTQLPGVGDYVANAVMCFAFGRPAVLLDTNTERIVGRVCARSQARRWQVRVDLFELAGKSGPDAEFNYALLDLGALICHIAKPDCAACPLRAICSASTAHDATQRKPLTEFPAANN